MLNYLLQSNIITLFFNGDSVSMNWIAKLINGLINAIGIVGVGVVVFTLILKLITLPLDVYSKASMRKNSLKMEKMRPQLEKLQKQYANDQQMYNAKMMELYKKNGYSMLGACLPLIVSLVVFMLVLNAFNSYSRYTDLQVQPDGERLFRRRSGIRPLPRFGSRARLYLFGIREECGRSHAV